MKHKPGCPADIETVSILGQDGVSISLCESLSPKFRGLISGPAAILSLATATCPAQIPKTTGTLSCQDLTLGPGSWHHQIALNTPVRNVVDVFTKVAHWDAQPDAHAAFDAYAWAKVQYECAGDNISHQQFTPSSWAVVYSAVFAVFAVPEMSLHAALPDIDVDVRDPADNVVYPNVTDHVLSDASDVIDVPSVDFDSNITAALALRQMFVSANAAPATNNAKTNIITRFITFPFWLICDMPYVCAVADVHSARCTPRHNIHIAYCRAIADLYRWPCRLCPVNPIRHQVANVPL